MSQTSRESSAPTGDAPGAVTSSAPWLAAMPPEYLARAAPPTVPGPLGGIARMSRWPGVVGSISVALGVLGIIAGGLGAVSQLLSSRIQTMVPGQQGMFDAQRKWLVESLVVQSVGVLIAALLTLAGVALLLRRPWARPVFFAWAGLRVLGGAAAAVVTYAMQRDQFGAMGAMSPVGGTGPPPAVMGAIGDITAIATAVGYGLWAVVWPAFIVVWLCRASIRREIAGWTRAPAAPTAGGD